MADRTSARAFAEIFCLLAKKPDDRAKDIASGVFKISEDYDFAPDQMECDKQLAKLGLARKGIDPDYPEDGTVWIYGKTK